MTKKTIWLMSGIPGSGKSTWIKNRLNEDTDIWCSRDAVRFSMVKEDEEYFSREDDVYNEWINQICQALNDEDIENIYIDATHLNDKSRNKTLNRLPKENVKEIINVVFLVPIEVCLERNAQRTGREMVPESVIRNMANSYSMPKKYSTIIINEKGEEKYGTHFYNLGFTSGA